MPQAKLTAFMAKATSPQKAKQLAAATKQRPKQQKLESLRGVLRLPKMSGHATEAELQRLLSELDASSSDAALISALRQLACYEVTVDQLEAVPLGKRVKQLRQHTNPEVQQQAQRVLKKLRQDVADACRRANKAKPILAKLKPVPKTSATLEG